MPCRVKRLDALKHWVYWLHEEPSLIKNTGLCASLERFYAFDESRFKYSEPRSRFKPCYKTGEKVEKIITKYLTRLELECIKYQEYYMRGAPDYIVARRLKIPLASFRKYYQVSITKIGRNL